MMRTRERSGDGFRYVPLILHETDGFAFLNKKFTAGIRWTVC